MPSLFDLEGGGGDPEKLKAGLGAFARARGDSGSSGAALLWQLTSRFEVSRGLTFDEGKNRLCWDATIPIPSDEYGVRRWPAITLHSQETLDKLNSHPELANYSWPKHLEFGGK